VIESGPDDEGLDTYYVFGNNITITPVQAYTYQAGGDTALLTALSAGVRKTNANGKLTSEAAVFTTDDGFKSRTAMSSGTYNVVI
jgi:hypothetical protein